MSIFAQAGVLAVMIVLGLLLGKLDHDAGGYVDGLFTKSTFPDKAVHFVCAVGATFALARLIPIEFAVADVIAAGAAVEVAQGFFSWYDLAADVAGALAVCLFITLT